MDLGWWDKPPGGVQSAMDAWIESFNKGFLSAYLMPGSRVPVANEIGHILPDDREYLHILPESGRVLWTGNES